MAGIHPQPGDCARWAVLWIRPHGEHRAELLPLVRPGSRSELGPAVAVRLQGSGGSGVRWWRGRPGSAQETSPEASARFLAEWRTLARPARRPPGIVPRRVVI